MSSLDTKKLDEISAVCYVNRGPFFNDLDNNKIFSANNKLGSPIDMEIHSSINGFYRYGYITIYDETGFREAFPLTGNEVISVLYRNTFRDIQSTLPQTIHFNIFDIEEQIADATQFNSKRFSGKILKIHLIEAPFFLKYNDRAWKVAFGSSDSYILPKSKAPVAQSNGMYVHDIFTKHFTEHLKLLTGNSKTDLIETDFQKTKTKLHFVCPSWKTQKLFSYLLDFAKDENDSGNIKLYPTTNLQSSRPIVHLKSLNQMFKDTNNKAVIFNLVDNSALTSNPQALGMKGLNQILYHKFLMYDLSSLPSGFAGASLLNFDYATGEYFAHNDTYSESNKKKGNSYFSNYGLWADTISNENTKQYYIGSLPRDIAKNYLNNKIIKNRHQLRCEMITYIDEMIQPGSKILATFPSGMSELTREQQSHLFDEHMSDEWIVEEIVDKYENGLGSRKMICIKDSFFNVYGKPTGSESTSYLPPVTYVNKK